MRTSAAILILIFLCAPFVNASELVIKRVTAAPQIDGVLEPLWNGALLFDHFEQSEPSFGAPAEAVTQVSLMRDDEYLYVGAKAYQPRTSIRASSARRDSAAITQSDHLTFVIDPQASGNSAYYFVVNPVNSVMDGTVDMYGNWPPDWDARIVTAARAGADAWTVEVAIPLSAIGFQTASGSHFGFLAQRYWAEKQETSLSRIGDRNSIYRIDQFTRVSAGEGAIAHRSLSLVPYSFGSWQSHPSADAARLETNAKAKGGLDLRFTPISTMTILATANPDFAQVEADQLVINVSDVPTAYPEKRPFFTESADLFPGLAVNTRNIGGIRAGLKVRQVLPKVRYDVTTVLDDHQTKWTLGDVRWTDNNSYHVEVIGGLKDTQEQRDYNVTTNLRTWALDHRFSAYTWFGTINSHQKSGNEWESVNSVRWDTRRFRAGLWNHFKTERYNPNIVGFDALSNEIIVKGWVSWSYFRNEGRLREITPEIDVERYDLYSSRGHDWNVTTALLTAVLRPSERLGVWRWNFAYAPAARSLFRYRGTAATELARYRDAYGSFALVGQHGATTLAEVVTDNSKTLFSKLCYFEEPLRGTTSRKLLLEGTWRIGQTTSVSASVEDLHVGTSMWQQPTKQTINRFRLEHTFPRDINLRAVVQSSSLVAATTMRTPAVNLLLSWPYDPRTTFYLVLNATRQIDDQQTNLPAETRNIAVKVSHAISF